MTSMTDVSVRRGGFDSLAPGPHGYLLIVPLYKYFYS